MFDSVWQVLFSSRSMLVALAVAGMLFTASVSAWLFWLDYRAAQQSFHEQVDSRARYLSSELRQSMEALYTLRDVIRYVDSLPVIVFDDVGVAALQRNPLLKTVHWLPRITQQQRLQFEQSLGSDRHIESVNGSGQRQRAALSEEYFPVRYVTPREDNELLVGVDMMSWPLFLEAAERARDQGVLSMSAPLPLSQLGHLGDTGIMVILPVYTGRPDSVSARRAALRGFVVAMINVEEFVSETLTNWQQQRWLKIEDLGVANDGLLLQYGVPSTHRYEVIMPEFAGRQWRLAMSPKWRTISAEISLLPVAAMMVGTLMVIIVCGYLWLLQRRAKLVESLVSERTQELREANQRLASLSITDPLTGLANRRALDDYLAHEWQRAARDRASISVLLLDVDHFKKLNDTWGHQIGDQCLRELANIMTAHFKRPADLVARYGGEEFAVILPNTDGSALEHANRFRERLAAHKINVGGDQYLQITISGGLATLTPALNQMPRDLLKQADEALYKAKRQGRNRIELASNTPAIT
jgi:diguanylate cyclase (GGDEF)-like protein